MKQWWEKLLAWGKRTTKRLLQRIRILYKRIKYLLEADRTLRSRTAYWTLLIGMAVLSVILVAINLGIFALSENSIYGKESYENNAIYASSSFSDPLSRKLRVSLYRSCTIEGAERAPMPEERTREQATQAIQSLWTETLSYLAPENKTLRTGENVDRVLRNSRYTVKLRDFYNRTNDTKIAVWSAQAYFTASDGRVYCLSAEMDTRTEDIYAITVALFENIDGSDPKEDFYPILKALKESYSLAENTISMPAENGSKTTLTLSDGTKLHRYTEIGSQIYLVLE